MMSIFRTGKNQELNEIYFRLRMDCSNNYKDAAQEDWKEYQLKFQEAKDKMKEKEREHYQKIYDEYEEAMRQYHH
jgi:hypothetical protein